MTALFLESPIRTSYIPDVFLYGDGAPARPSARASGLVSRESGEALAASLVVDLLPKLRSAAEACWGDPSDGVALFTVLSGGPRSGRPNKFGRRIIRSHRLERWGVDAALVGAGTGRDEATAVLRLPEGMGPDVVLRLEEEPYGALEVTVPDRLVPWIWLRLLSAPPELPFDLLTVEAAAGGRALPGGIDVPARDPHDPHDPRPVGVPYLVGWA